MIDFIFSGLQLQTMESRTGSLRERDKAKIADWLNKKAPLHSCPSCGQNSWTIVDDLINYMPYTGPNLVIGGASYPAVLTVCTNCYFAKTYMAAPIGLLDQESEKNSNVE